jgi:hypothetical protein
MAVVTRLATKAQSNLRDEIRNISHSASHYSRNFRKHSRRAFFVLATRLGFHLSDDAALEFASDDFLGKLTRYYLALPLRFVRYIAMLPIRMLASGWRAIFRTIAYIESLKYFTNACGDFTLLSKADWERLRGYPEWPIFSFHIDSILLYQANRAGLTEVHLSRENAIYHIEHGPGSGFTPEHADKMFARLDARGIPYLDWTSDVQTILEDMNRMRDAHVPVVFNEADWGYRSIVLEDIPVCATEAVPA